MNPKKIAVLRANALGDYIFVLPALQALRERFPQTEIVYLGKQWHQEFLSGRPGPVDRVIVVPPYPGVSENETFQYDRALLNNFFEEMQQEEFDIAFQLHGGGGNSNPFLLRLGAKLTVGLKTSVAPALDISVPYVYYFSEILRYLEVVSHVGAVTTRTSPEVIVLDRDIDEAIETIGQRNGPFVVIHPGASDLRRRWPAERFAEIADDLSKRGYSVYLTGSPYESEVLEGLMKHTRQPSIHNLCGKLSLGGLTGLLSQADLLVANDTGPLHLARALGTPTVGIYWCGNGITGLPMTTFYNRSLLSFAIHCPLCGLSSTKFNNPHYPGDCTHEVSFVADVETQAVREQIDELMELISNHRRPEDTEEIISKTPFPNN